MLDTFTMKFFRQELVKKASSRVKSPDAFYAPPSSPEGPPPITASNNLEAVQRQAVAVSQEHKNRAARKLALQAPAVAAPPSIQTNMPMTRPPFPPRYTGT